MANFDIIRALKDEEYRNNLSEEQQAQLPESPAGAIELTTEELHSVAGGSQTYTLTCTLRNHDNCCIA